ncbi:fungal-specific transcription factor domain-containing protein [Favolaschia claudopus]|uniref:Fungal-specific transcription factor domain-containing protein n=1 Tax=Favolaschia claudopus TaxID=2862362 RepID=A0AAW0DIQ6_9AGAR
MEASPAQGTSSSSSSSPPPPTNAGRKSQITSCMECRRLKLRCDRIFPCSSCIRRGCANLCPNGTLEKGKRGFLKRLEQSLPAYPKPGQTVDGAASGQSEVAMFIARDSAMTKRIHELEAALVAAGLSIPSGSGNASTAAASTTQENEGRAKRQRTSSMSDSASPSASSETVSTSSRSTMSMNTTVMPVDTTDLTLGFGTLTIDVENRSRYVGPSGGAAYLNAELWKSQTPDRTGRTAADRGEDNTAQPSASPRRSSHVEAQIIATMGCLPPYDEAVRIASLYFKNAAFMYEVIPEKIFFSTHLPTIYPDSMNPYLPAQLHVLALTAIVLALGTLFDLSVPVDTVRPRAAPFYDLAVAALNITVPLNIDTIPAVQTLHLMALYFLSTQGETGGEPAWQLLGMAMRSIQAQGCHRDGSRWELPSQELEERRRVFWETLMYDRLQSFTFGRPYAQGDDHYDCEMPQSCDTPLPSDNDAVQSSWSHTGWHTHKFRFAIILGRIVDKVFSVKLPAYAVIMDLDREINANYDELPRWIICDAVENPVKELPAHALGAESDMRRNAQIASLANMYFLTLLHLHRGPFCRALMMDAKNLENSRYAASIVSLHRAARAMINIARGLFALHPAITSRMWYWLFHSFTAAVCQAVLVIVAPSHPLAHAAFESMQAAAELFARADGERAKSAAVRVGWLAAQASRTMEAYRAAQMRQSPTTSQSSNAAGPKLAFPTSNIREIPAELLGTSTKLVRAQPEEAFSSPSPSSVPPPHLHAADGNVGGFQFASDGRPHSGFSTSMMQHEQLWAPQAPPQRAGSTGSPLTWSEYGDGGYRNIPSALNSNPPYVDHNSISQGQQGQSHFQAMDSSMYASVDGFDLSRFIQSGANAWLFDRGSELESEDLPHQSAWHEHRQ